jgi:hypothetical protein
VTSDPLAPLAELPGVAQASDDAREALGKARRHRTNLRGWPATAAEAALRAARASAVLEGASLHLPESGEPDPLLDPARPFAAGVRDGLTGRFMAWSDWLARGLAEDEAEALRQATRTGRPCGGTAFVKALETALARPLAPQKRGPKPKTEDETLEIPGLF